MSIRSVHSARTVRIQRSAYAFMRGHCGAEDSTSMPSAANTASNPSVNCPARSRIRYRTSATRSDSVQVNTPCGLHRPLARGMWGYAEQVHEPVAHVDDEGHVHAGQIRQIHVE